jgi:hypothetical protein
VSCAHCPIWTFVPSLIIHITVIILPRPSWASPSLFLISLRVSLSSLCVICVRPCVTHVRVVPAALPVPLHFSLSNSPHSALPILCLSLVLPYSPCLSPCRPSLGCVRPVVHVCVLCPLPVYFLLLLCPILLTFCSLRSAATPTLISLPLLASADAGPCRSHTRCVRSYGTRVYLVPTALLGFKCTDVADVPYCTTLPYPSCISPSLCLSL